MNVTDPTQENSTPAARVAIFIDGPNFKHAAYDSFGIRVDYAKLLDVFSRNEILLRAHYYSGEISNETIDQLVRIGDFHSINIRRKRLEERRRKEQRFYRFLARNGFKVVTKPIKVFADSYSKIKLKANLDIEITLDMLRLADKCDKQVLFSGDGDFAPAVDTVGKRGVRVVVVSTQAPGAYAKSGYRASDELVDAADEFIDIYDIKEHIEFESEKRQLFNISTLRSKS